MFCWFSCDRLKRNSSYKRVNKNFKSVFKTILRQYLVELQPQWIRHVVFFFTGTGLLWYNASSFGFLSSATDSHLDLAQIMMHRRAKHSFIALACLLYVQEYLPDGLECQIFFCLYNIFSSSNCQVFSSTLLLINSSYLFSPS